jgi:two-component system response regulator AtoC
MLMPFVFGTHKRMKDLEARIGSIARSGLPVLIEGESGTGKEALAELLHRTSGVDAPFSRVICRKTRPSSGIEGSTADLALEYLKRRGTVFLKNAHLLSPAEQEQLVASLEESTDSDKSSDAAARVVSSATESLEAMVGRRQLSSDLYHRLAVFRINLPTLRERRQDIPELFSRMVLMAANGNGAPSPPSSRLLESLMAYDWPGNLRELQNIARMYSVTAGAEEIMAEVGNRSRMILSASPEERNGKSLKDQVKGASQKLESEIILRTLELHHWNRRRAAETLQISYRSLLYKMKSCNLRDLATSTPEGR